MLLYSSGNHHCLARKKELNKKPKIFNSGHHLALDSSVTWDKAPSYLGIRFMTWAIIDGFKGPSSTNSVSLFTKWFSVYTHARTHTLYTYNSNIFLLTPTLIYSSWQLLRFFYCSFTRNLFILLFIKYVSSKYNVTALKGVGNT